MNRIDAREAGESIAQFLRENPNASPEETARAVLAAASILLTLADFGVMVRASGFQIRAHPMTGYVVAPA